MGHGPGCPCGQHHDQVNERMREQHAAAYRRHGFEPPAFGPHVPLNPAKMASHSVAFFRGVRMGRVDSRGEVGEVTAEVIDAQLEVRGLVAERFGLPIFGREHARTTQVMAEQYGDDVWLGRDGDAR